ncbi:MAG: NAD(P)/FAD-dependent oxidoreductase [Pirellulales bacterium]|nr:NAD(P)/FAD-dependent oxidoreductase [Pirellulales bacterium]
MNSYDVLVVGAGLAGLQCTRILAGYGLKVLLVDRKTSLAQGIHTTGIFVRRSLEDFSLPGAYLGPPIRHVRLYSPARRALDLVSNHEEFRVGRMAELYERWLRDCRAAGAEWQPGVSYLRSEPAGRGTLAHLSAGGRPESILARYVVAADGVNSHVARDCGLSQNRRWIVGLEDVFTGVPLDGPPRLHCFLDAGIAPGYIAWATHDGESVHVGVGGAGRGFQPAVALGRFRTTLAGILPLRGRTADQRRGGRIPVGGILPRIVNARALALGDAAGAVSPLTAGGLDPCLRLSELAAKVIWRYLASDDPAELTPYDAGQFRNSFRKRLLMRSLFQALAYNPLLELGCAALRYSATSSVARRIFFGRGSFPDVFHLATPPNRANDSAAAIAKPQPARGG